MKKNSILTILMISTLMLISCGKETLTPMVAPVTINELRDDQPVHFSYKIEETKIDEYAQNTSKFPIFGKLFQSIAHTLANSKIAKEGGHLLDLPAMEVDLSSLDQIDFEYVEWIRLDSLSLIISNAKKADTLAFIGKIEIYAQLDEPVKGIPQDKEGLYRLVYFDIKEHKIECENRCINLKSEKINWKEILRKNKKVKLQPKITINSVPKSSMALAGSVGFSVKFKLGF